MTLIKELPSAILALALSLIAAAAYAEGGTTTVDFTAPLQVDGQPIVNDLKCPADKDGKRPCSTPTTLGELAFLFLERPQQGQDWTAAIKRDDLAHAIREAKAFPLLPDQLSTIQAALGPYLSPAIIGVVNKMLTSPPSK